MSLLSEYIAVLLLESALDDDREEYGGSISTIAGRLGERVSGNLRQDDVDHALQILEPFAAAERDFSPLTGGFWHVKFDNFRYYFIQDMPDHGDDEDDYARLKEMAEKFPVLMAYARRGSPYARDTQEALRDMESDELNSFRQRDKSDFPIANIPASNRIITIDHNSREFNELTSATEQASEAVRTANSLDSDSRGWIRDHLEAGLELIKHHKILATAVSALLLQPLLNAYNAVTEESAKEAILAAINIIRSFFGVQ